MACIRKPRARHAFRRIQTLDFIMNISADKILKLVEEELSTINDSRVIKHIRSLLGTPVIFMRQWDYGEPNTKYPCWSVLNHVSSNTGIAYSEHGFGPTYPWGLVFLTGDENCMSMGMDSGWFPSFVEAYFDSQASCELPIWRVFKRVDEAYPGVPITDESD